MNHETNTLKIDACPHCGAERIPMPRFDDGTPEYACGAFGNIRTAYCRLWGRVQKAESELSEIKETYASIVQQPHFDEREVHCSCVPALRAEVERFRVYLARAIEIAEMHLGHSRSEWHDASRADLHQIKATLHTTTK